MARVDFARDARRIALAFSASALAFAVGCGGGGSGGSPVPSVRGTPAPVGDGLRGKNGIDHIVIIIQENRSFDTMFHNYPGADTVSSGKTHDGRTVPLTPGSLATTFDINHGERNFLTAYDNGKMDGFDIEDPHENGLLAYSYVKQSEVQQYWDMASKYVLADETFASQIDGSFSAHQYLVAGESGKAVDDPSAFPWGCDAAAGTVVPTLNPDRTEGPEIFPCFTYSSMATTLDTAKATWRYYAPTDADVGGEVWSGFDAVRAVRMGPDWSAHVVTPETTFLTDVASGTLSNVTWVVPDEKNSDHSGNNSATGPDWVSSLVNAVGTSKFWNDSAIVVLWDDWGGWYDHVPPKYLDAHGLGFRVPMMVISPYAKKNHVSHVQYEFGSVLKFAENTFGLPALSASDQRATSLDDCFDFTQQPRPYTSLRVHRTVRDFITERPSGKAPDDE